MPILSDQHVIVAFESSFKFCCLGLNIPKQWHSLTCIFSPTPLSLLQTVASPQVSKPFSKSSMVWTLGSQEPLDIMDKGFQHCLFTGTTHSPFLSTVSYHQGVLSATILYEILLGKATLYAVLVSALVLMAMVRMVGWDTSG